MPLNKKQQICRLLKGIETGDPDSVAVVNEEKYIQHNPQTHEGSEGLAALFKRLSETNPKVNIVRVFEDGEFVFAHTEYDFASRNIGFEIFRFENDQAVEHWDNIQTRMGPNPSGFSMVDGETESTDLDKTESNRMQVQMFIEQVLIQCRAERIDNYIMANRLTEHNPHSSNALEHLKTVISSSTSHPVNYLKCHRILAEGNFVLSVCEGSVNQVATSFFDLYRLDDGYIVEHWDTTEAIPPPEEWKNTNGKF